MVKLFCRGIIVVALFPISIWAQESATDSLKTSLRSHTQSDTIRFDLLIGLIRATRIDFPDSAIGYGEEAHRLSMKLKDYRREAQALNLLGTSFYYKGQYEQAEASQRKAIAVCNMHHVESERANALASLALALQSQGKYSEAIETYYETLKLEEKNRNPKGVIKISTNLSILYRNLGDYDNSIRYGRYSYHALTKDFKSWDQALASVTNTLGLCFMDIKRYDSALYYLHQSRVYNVRTKNITYSANSASNISHCYLEVNQLDSAAKYIEIAFQSVPQISNQYVLAGIYTNRGSIRLTQGKAVEALSLLKKGLALASQSDAKKSILESYISLAEVYRQQNDFAKAYEFVNKAYELNDSLKNSEAQRSSANIQRDYEIQKKQQSIDLLAQQARLQDAQLKNEQQVRYYLILSVMLLVLVVGLAYFGFRTKVKSNRRLQAKSDEIADKNILLENVNRNLQDQALRSQMKPHFIFNSLNSIQYLILQKENDKAFEYLSKFSQLLRSALEFSDMNFIELEKELKWLELYVKLEGLRFNHEFEFSIQYKDPETEFQKVQLPPFLVQPFVENAIAHGLMPKTGSRSLRILLGKNNGNLKINICDNGIGRKESARQKAESRKMHRSVGMDIVKKRLEILQNLSGKKFECHIEDGVDENGNPQGTSVTLTLPI